MIYVTVGTMFLDFARLIRKMDDIAQSTGERIICQIGMGETVPVHCEHFRFKPRQEIVALQREARVIVAHAGIGCVIEAMQASRPLIVVPRLKKHNEHMDDHQLDLAQAVARRGWGRMIVHMDDLAEALANPLPAKTDYEPATVPLVRSIQSAVAQVAMNLARSR
ncbi:MAG: hypothetical protein AMXMBFR84_06310 [Candidatus Hydrogenedentota bacterium]